MKKLITYSAISIFTILTGCSAPPLKFYTLNETGPRQSERVSNYTNSAPVIYVSQVTVPDYLNTTDIITRTQSTLNHSPNGRMSSILSIGATEFITHVLADKNPNLFITNQTQIEPPTYQLMINISRFDVQEDASKTGHITLEANWSIVPKNENQSIQKQRATFTAQSKLYNDSDIIELEQNALTQLSTAINNSLATLR
ncbi:PqiC family protein [Commensalibacter oyaizuii]|uniref:PqiC family protein n=1 Tax=Commensalibacter oyaizuii TaxID=3043873 RepID=A0ABT6Q1W6_9PROT|nr:PqiC family protein [Commensalibacter sp. TBRC 16381]MDI2091092.1 PqiC family protein [Commensalibacter sp. TBRC 16381]